MFDRVWIQTNFLKCYDWVENTGIKYWRCSIVLWNESKVLLITHVNFGENRFDLYCIPADSKDTLQNNVIEQYLIKFTKTPIIAWNVSFTLAK